MNHPLRKLVGFKAFAMLLFCGCVLGAVVGVLVEKSAPYGQDVWPVFVFMLFGEGAALLIFFTLCLLLVDSERFIRQPRSQSESQEKKSPQAPRGRFDVRLARFVSRAGSEEDRSLPSSTMDYWQKERFTKPTGPKPLSLIQAVLRRIAAIVNRR